MLKAWNIKKYLGVSLFCFLISGSSGFAGQIMERCEDDKLTTAAQGHGRNGWSRKCGYISAEEETFLNARGLYVVFTTTQVPALQAAECRTGLRVFAFCAVGCYSPEQRLLFDDEWLAIADAARQDRTQLQVSSVADYQALGGARLVPQAIESFTRGGDSAGLQVITLANGNTLRVTPDHPLVHASGRMVRADSLRVGEYLLGLDGLVSILGIETRAFTGDVWNIRPVSTAKLDNILVVEGVLTGSQRFQYEWARQVYRRALRAQGYWQ